MVLRSVATVFGSKDNSVAKLDIVIASSGNGFLLCFIVIAG